MSKKKTKKRRRGRGARRPTPKRQDLPLGELKEILDRAKSVLSPDDHDKLEAAVDTLAFLTRELEAKGASIKRLRKLIFGASTEKTSQVFSDRNDERKDEPASDEDGEHDDGAAAPDADGDEGDASSKPEPKPKPKRKGHGRRGAAEYTGADKEPVPHDTLSLHRSGGEQLLRGLVVLVIVEHRDTGHRDRAHPLADVDLTAVVDDDELRSLFSLELYLGWVIVLGNHTLIMPPRARTREAMCHPARARARR